MSTVTFNLRIDEKINDKLIEIAEKQGRSKNKQIEFILKEFIEKFEEEENRKAKLKRCNIERIK